MTVADIFKQNEGRMDVDVRTVHHFSDGMYAKQMHLPAGYFAVSHKHDYAHLSILAAGEVDVHTDEGKVRYVAPACIEIKAGVHHMICATKDATWFCIHPTDEKDPEAIDKVAIQKE